MRSVVLVRVAPAPAAGLEWDGTHAGPGARQDARGLDQT
jgi:hypothetical protein